MSIIDKLGITPGPWRWTMIDEHTPQLEGTNEYSEMNPVLVAFDCGCGVRKEDNACPLRPIIKDQKIISAAPEMFEALIEYTIDLEQSGRKHLSRWSQNIVIIEKATGLEWEKIKELLK